MEAFAAYSAYRPAGQVSAKAAPTSAIGVAADGRITGIDGMLDQVAGALVRQATPVVKTQILPALQQDKALQGTVGTAAGVAMADQLRPWVILGAVSLVAIAGTMLYRSIHSRNRRSSRSRRSAR